MTLFFKNPVPVVHPVLWGLAINTVAYVLVSLATPAPPQEVVERIHSYLDEVIWREVN